MTQPLDHPSWCGPECSAAFPSGAHRSKPWRIRDGAFEGCVSVQQRRGHAAEVVVSSGPVARGLSADGAESLADALEEAAEVLRGG